jgi:hypothetical protein
MVASELPAVVQLVQQRYNEATPRADAKSLWTATYVLMGLRYPLPFIEQLLREGTAMEESVTYQAIIAKGIAKGVEKGFREGAVQELKKALLLQGRELFGEPTAAIKAAIEGIDDLGRLEGLSVRLVRVKSWEELLDLPACS